MKQFKTNADAQKAFTLILIKTAASAKRDA